MASPESFTPRPVSALSSPASSWTIPTADRQAIQSVLTGILMYPLSKFTGQDADQGLVQGSHLSQHLH